jgi:hypothetical protein
MNGLKANIIPISFCKIQKQEVIGVNWDIVRKT